MQSKVEPALSLNSSNTILMVRPANFSANLETLSDNAFQTQSEPLSSKEVQNKSLAEFDNFVNVLKQEGVNVIVVEDTHEPIKPDAIFPNNWFTADKNGLVVIYPMKPVSRRSEKSNPVLNDLTKLGYDIKEIIDLSYYESEDPAIFLEGTGSMILDHQNKIAYACYAERTHASLFEKTCKELFHYNPIIFTAVDEKNKAYYHTNVIMSVCSDFVIVCLEAIPQQEANLLKKSILGSKSSIAEKYKEIVEISREQVNNFCGNVLEVQTIKGEKILTMSEAAYNSYNEKQLSTFQKYCRIVKVNIDCISKCGGGATRCMMAEIFLPKKE